MCSHGWRLASELKVILDIYRVAILVGSFWLSLLSKDSWGKALKYSFSHQELLSSVALYGFWSTHWIIHPQLSPLYLQYGIINTFCTEGHRSDISQISSGRNKFIVTQYFHLFCWLRDEPGTAFRGKVTEKTPCYHCILIWVKCQEYAVLSFIFLFISPWRNKACRQDIVGLPWHSLKVNGHLIFSLVFSGTGASQPFPQSCASVLSCVSAEMVSEMTSTSEVWFQLQLESRMLMGLGILFQMCESLVLLLLIPVQTNQK